VSGKKPRALITGVAGFGGSHLAEHLVERGFVVLGLDHPSASQANLAGISVEMLSADLADLDRRELNDFIGRTEPAAVFHLAGMASVRRSWDSVKETVSVNSLGTLNLLEALLGRSSRPPLLLVGSAEEYGAVPPRRQPIREDAPLAPKSPYSLSKVWQESLGSYYRRLEDWPLYMTRTFNHTGPRQNPDFVCADFARQIALIEGGGAEELIRVGNLKARRDFLDVRDVVRAYRLVVEKGRPGGIYNVCSGGKWKISELLAILLSLSSKKIRVEVDSDKIRPVDIPLLCGDPSRLRRSTGWKPKVPIEKTLGDLLEYWRIRVREE
jgi:GDP-4-dehydro-6-deoxy-D-mannose reductase